MTNSSLDFGFQDGTYAATQTAAKSPSIPLFLNSDGKPTYHPTSARDSEKISMREINQPIDEECETSPRKITTQYSHTNGSDHENNSGKETQVGVNKDAMVMDEEIHDGNDSEDGSPDVDGTNNAALGGNDGQDEDMREEEAEYQSLFHNGPGGDDDDDLEEEDKNGEGNKDDNNEINEGQPHGPTTATPTADTIPKGTKTSTGTTRGLSLEELSALKQSQPLEYLKVVLSRRESSSERCLSTSTASEDQPSSKHVDEALLKIKENIFKRDLLILLLVDPFAL